MSRSVKRIMSEAKELQECPAADFVAAPLDDNLFEWHFTLRGVAGTAFEGGRYHGRIMLPPEYPFKPPSIFLLTPNGRFETGRKICLSVSAHHPESWQPAWGVRTILNWRAGGRASGPNSTSEARVAPEVHRQGAKHLTNTTRRRHHKTKSNNNSSVF